MEFLVARWWREFKINSAGYEVLIEIDSDGTIKRFTSASLEYKPNDQYIIRLIPVPSNGSFLHKRTLMKIVRRMKMSELNFSRNKDKLKIDISIESFIARFIEACRPINVKTITLIPHVREIHIVYF